MEFFDYHDFGMLHHAKIWLLAIVCTYYRFVTTKKQIIDYDGRKTVIKRTIFGLIWFFVIFIISYSIGGYFYIKTTGIAISGGFQAGLEAGRAVRDAYQEAYIMYFVIGSLILAILGTGTGILPGTKKKSSTKKKARKKK